MIGMIEQEDGGGDGEEDAGREWSRTIEREAMERRMQGENGAG